MAKDKRQGNQFWKARKTHGRKPIFATPEELWEACEEYLEWVEANPLITVETVKFQGRASLTEVPKMRAMTEIGLCVFLKIGQSTWDDYKNKDDFSEVTTRVVDIIYTQKFTGAAADLLNPNIIARDLGLADKKELTGKDGAELPAAVINVTTTAAT
ncbi:MAG: DNA-packaging protein [Alphaproteobacteria bacterium]|nr:MAG: DNA-packaging protein [Alphaproteobacteria bacterium]